MQKSRLIFVSVLIAIIAAGITACAQQSPASPPATASVTFADGKTVTINYSRPSMRGRTIFGGLVPYGQVWRTGANAATSLKTDVDLTIGGANVPAGSYTLYSIPNENGWKLIINKETGQSLREAFAVISQVRLDHQAEQIRHGLKPDNLLRPDELPPLARAELREAFQAIGRAQQQLNRFVPLGI